MAASPAPSTGALTAGRTLPAEGMDGPMKTGVTTSGLASRGQNAGSPAPLLCPAPPVGVGPARVHACASLDFEWT